jgi:hypothetical protein
MITHTCKLSDTESLNIKIQQSAEGNRWWKGEVFYVTTGTESNNRPIKFTQPTEAELLEEIQSWICREFGNFQILTTRIA